jgi:hypothetical protein
MSVRRPAQACCKQRVAFGTRCCCLLHWEHTTPCLRYNMWRRLAREPAKETSTAPLQWVLMVDSRGSGDRTLRRTDWEYSESGGHGWHQESR